MKPEDSGHSEEGIQFHWDTDEVAVERHGVNVHPHLSTWLQIALEFGVGMTVLPDGS